MRRHAKGAIHALQKLKLISAQVFRLDRDLRSCPADRDDLGAASWKLLHTLSASLPDRPSAEQRRDVEQFVGLFARLYPCRPCGEDFEQDIKENPVRTTSATEFAQWLCGAHNRVNKKLGKEEFDCSKVLPNKKIHATIPKRPFLGLRAVARRLERRVLRLLTTLSTYTIVRENEYWNRLEAHI